MAGEGVSSLILLSASIVVAVIVASAIFIVANNYKSSLSDREKIENHYLTSKIEIINDLAYSPYNATTGNLTLYVKNIGYTVLSMNHTAVFLNGTAYTVQYPDTIAPLSGNVWAPQVVVKITVHLSTSLKSGDYLVTVVAEYGVKDTISFRV
jgi:archaellum component FlaG (FlaF/FlaG flagellin family)